VFVCTAENRHHELAGQPVGALAPDGHGGALAIVSGHTLRRRAPDGEWITLATSELQLSCCVSVGDVIYVGTDDARVLRVSETCDIEPLRGFEAVAGRDTWYAGSAVIDGQRVGPPLGIRSITVTADRRVLLANVHVGGIADTRCIATQGSAAAVADRGGNLWFSTDSGQIWVRHAEGLPAPSSVLIL
jgi:hypothetical protein